MSVVRAELHAPAVISIAQRQGMLAVVPTGQSGPPGPMTNWRMSSGWIQARAVGYGGDWTNVVEIADITGPMPAHSWSGTQLRFETAPGVWGSYVDLKGDAVEIGVDGGFIRWRPVGGAWANIVELADLIGPDGPAIEVQTTATHIQWRVVGDPTWINLVALTDIKGDQGDPGPIGINLPLGPWNSATAYVARDVVTLNGSSYICLLGHTNQSPPTPPATANTYWSLLASKGDTPTVIDLDAVEGLNSELLGSAHSAITVAATDIVAEFVYDTTLDDDKGAWRHRCAHTSWWQEAASATRGSKREFPQKAKIIFRSGSTDTIAVYDITDTDSSGAAKLWWKSNSAAFVSTVTVNIPTAAFALNGRLWLAYSGTSGRLIEINFVADTITVYTNSTTTNRRGRGVLTTSGSPPIDSSVPALVDRSINHVTARVYPGAPVDAYGLPIPKVAVATAGGVSVIHEDGSVYDITRSAPGNSRAYFLADGRIAAALASSAQVDILPVPYADATVAAIRQAFYSTVGANLPTLSGTTGALVAAADAVAVGNAQGLSLFLPNPGAESAGMFAYSAVAYATGWQVGDIRGAYLCDTTTGNITGTAELVTNGDFATGATGWTQVFGTVAQTGGKLRCTALGGTGARAAQSITCVVGQTYLLSVDITNVSANGTVFVNTTSATGTGAVAIETGVTGRRLLQFVATATTMFVALQVQSTTDGQATDFDNVSVKLAVPDRSYKAKGLQVVGTLSRTAVNTGNDLAWFSGWSGSNYGFQPYNPDIDFGTGDFSLVVWFKTTDATAASRYMMDRTDSHASPTAGRLRLLMDSSHRAAFWPRDATTDYFVNGTTALNDGSPHQIIAQRRGSNLELHVDGRLEATVAITAGGNFSNTLASLFVGIRQDLASQWFVGNLGMLRLSATSLSAAQIARMYRDEAPLFNAGAKACLGGASNAVASMDFDSWSQRLLVGTGDGVSEFSGLVRVGYFDTSNTTLTNDAMKAVAAQGGYRSMAGGQQSIVVRDKVSQHDVVNAYPEQPPAWVADEIAAIRALVFMGL